MTPASHAALEVALERLRAGDYAGAEDGFRAALRETPDDVEALSLLGLACGAQDRSDEAVAHFDHAARVRPDPERLTNLGAALAKVGRLDEAAAAYLRALQLDPTYADAHRNYGVCRLRAGDEADAEARFREALRLRPDYPEALANLLALLRRQERYPEAIQVAGQMVELRPTDAVARAEMGVVLQRAGRLADAVACHAEAVRLQPDLATAHLNRGMALLALGQFAAGWAEFEWRWSALQLPRPAVPAPAWDGSDPAGRRLLLWAEQGLGDTLQFIRYADALRALGADVTFRCPPPLVQLLARTPGIARIVSEDDPIPACDAHVPLVSLPGLLGTRTLEDIPAPVPYVYPDPELVEAWADRVRAVPGFRVGVCWQGSPRNPEDRRRSFGPAALAPLAGVPGVSLVTLQKGDGADRLGEVGGRFAVHTLDGLDEAAPFVDTAAVMQHLHLVVTCDSAIAHLAGALGIPVWLALPAAADWRWLTGRADSPWYPTVQLFRQRVPGGWADVFDRMAARLRAPGRSFPIEVSPGELLDRLTILELKRDRLADSPDHAHVLADLARLTRTAAALALAPPEVGPLVAELRQVNADLWAAEDEVRDGERRQDFGPAFVRAARTVYLRNDRRARLKRDINDVLGSTLLEVKSHVRYDGPTPRSDASHPEPT